MIGIFGYESVCLGLRIPSHSRFASEEYCDLLFEVWGEVALLKTCVKELVETWEEDVERLMQEAVGDNFNARGFIRSCSAHFFLDLYEHESNRLESEQIISYFCPCGLGTQFN